jgi:hypothetical protein
VLALTKMFFFSIHNTLLIFRARDVFLFPNLSRHCRAWKILQPKAFEEQVIPLYFSTGRYASFLQQVRVWFLFVLDINTKSSSHEFVLSCRLFSYQVNRWGFNRITEGPDAKAYYHEMFLRGFPDLCSGIRRPTKQELPLPNQYGGCPGFSKMSKLAPLPELPMQQAKETTRNRVNTTTEQPPNGVMVEEEPIRGNNSTEEEAGTQQPGADIKIQPEEKYLVGVQGNNCKNNNRNPHQAAQSCSSEKNLGGVASSPARDPPLTAETALQHKATDHTEATSRDGSKLNTWVAIAAKRAPQPRATEKTPGEAQDSLEMKPRPRNFTFPRRLHAILSDPRNQEYITWLPHGRYVKSCLGAQRGVFSARSCQDVFVF